MIRARIVLAAAGALPNAEIAAEAGCARRHRAQVAPPVLPAPAWPGWPTCRAVGRPARFTPVQVAEVKALACELPAETGAPLARWSCPELAREAVTRGIVASISASTVRRWLAADAIKPWQHRSWIFPRDPDFAAKAARVLDLYARRWDGTPLRPGRVRDLRRREALHPGPQPHATPTCRPARAGPMRVEHEYAAAAPWPTWPPRTSTAPRCSAAASPPPASSRSTGWSTRS